MVGVSKGKDTMLLLLLGLLYASNLEANNIITEVNRADSITYFPCMSDMTTQSRLASCIKELPGNIVFKTNILL